MKIKIHHNIWITLQNLQYKLFCTSYSELFSFKADNNPICFYISVFLLSFHTEPGTFSTFCLVNNTHSSNKCRAKGKANRQQIIIDESDLLDPGPLLNTATPSGCSYS